MRVITLTCPDCGSIVAGNVLERRHRVPCPGPNCENTLRFADLTEDEQTHLVENADDYRMD